MADAEGADEALHVLLMEHIADQAVAFPEVQLVAVAGDDARRVLTAMLQHRKRVIELLIDVLVTYDSNDAAHSLALTLLQ